MKKKGFKLPTAYSILLIITILIAIITQFIPGVNPAKFSDIVMAPINGFKRCYRYIFIRTFNGWIFRYSNKNWRT